jgi:hypothetical protein
MQFSWLGSKSSKAFCTRHLGIFTRTSSCGYNESLSDYSYTAYRTTQKKLRFAITKPHLRPIQASNLQASTGAARKPPDVLADPPAAVPPPACRGQNRRPEGSWLGRGVRAFDYPSGVMLVACFSHEVRGGRKRTAHLNPLWLSPAARIDFPAHGYDAVR